MDQNQQEKKETWAQRRKLGIANNLRLFVITCMDERIPIFDALGIGLGDAHIFRNAGGIVTDDVLRSAMLTTHFIHTTKIIIIHHTDCGLLMTTGKEIAQELENRNVDIGSVAINPQVPELQLKDQKNSFSKWIQTYTDIDQMCIQQVNVLKQSPMIPNDVEIVGYIWDMEKSQLREPISK